MDTDVFFVRMPDLAPVTAVSERYLTKLSSSGHWTPEDWIAARNEWEADRRAATAASDVAFRAAMAGYPGCTVDDVHDLFPFASITCTIADAQALWAAGIVDCLEADSVWFVEDDSGEAYVDGHGLREFLPAPSFGAFAPLGTGPVTGYTPGRPDDVVVILENSVPPPLNEDHHAFRTPPVGTAFGTSRFLPSVGCRRTAAGTSCTSPAHASLENTSAHPHPQGTASVLLSSVMDGQDPNFSCPAASSTPFCPPTNAAEWAAHEDRSGFARGVTGRYMAPGGSEAAFAEAMEHNTDERVAMVNMSAAQHSGDRTDCDGNHNRAEAVSLAFEGGIPFFKSAGNQDGTGTAPEDLEGVPCNVSQPAGALAAFVVSSADTPVTSPAEPSIRVDRASHGDPLARRTIVDIAASTNFEPWYVGGASGFKPGEGAFLMAGMNGTSAAAPVVTGGAAIYRHAYESLPGNPTFIRVPEVLYARMLLQGDRTGHTGDTEPQTQVTLDEGFDAWWGAGRLAMRAIFQPGGVDPVTGLPRPARRVSRAGAACLKDDEYLELPLPEVSGTQTQLTFVLRFHDPLHARRGRLDEIEIALVEVLSPTGRGAPLVRDENREEKLRISAPLYPSDWVVQVHGVDIDHANPSACTSGGRLIYFAYSWE
jgi:hypothetical protein